MPNPFDQFDTPQGEQYYQNPFDQFDDSIGPAGGFSTLGGTESGMPKFTSEDIVRPFLEYGGLTLGATIGGASGPIGGVAGGGLMYAAGKQAADLLYDRPREDLPQELKRASGDVLTGAGIEAGGQVLGKVLSGAGNYLVRKYNALSPAVKAAKQLQANTTAGDIYAKNLDEALALENEIPGLKFTRGQSANDPALLKLERSKSATSGDAMAAANELRNQNTAAIERYVNDKFAGDADAAFNRIAQIGKGFDTSTRAASEELSKKMSQIGKGDVQAGGAEIRNILKASKDIAKEQSASLYDKVPNVKLKSSSIASSVKGLTSEFKKSGDAIKDFPSGIVRQLEEEIYSSAPKAAREIDLITGSRQASAPTLKDIDFTALRGIRTQIREAISDATRGANPNYKLARRLGKLSESVEGTLNQLSSMNNEAGEAFREASKYYAKEYAPLREGVVGEILKPGPGGFKLTDAEVLDKIFTSGNKGLSAADQFLKASGGKGKEIIKDYAEQKLLQEATNKSTGELTKEGLARFRFKYDGVLRKFGLDDQYKNLAAAQNALNSALENRALFEKSSAASLLKADPETAVRKALLGGSQSKNINELMRLVEKDKAATAGLQRAMVDTVIKELQPTAADPLKKGYLKYEPALKELFKNEPQKLASLLKARKAYEILNRTTRGLTGGSDTAEKMTDFLMQLTGGRATRVLRFITGPFQRVSKESQEKLLIKALYDPEFSYDLLVSLNKGDKFDGKIIDSLTKMITVGANDMFDESLQKEKQNRFFRDIEERYNNNELNDKQRAAYEELKRRGRL